MGTTFGSAVNDVTLLRIAELEHAANSQVQRSHGIVGYLRYRDDCIMAYDERNGFLAFWHQFKALIASQWDCSIERVVSSGPIKILDFTIQKVEFGDETYTTAFAPSTRDGTNVQLNPDSGHKPSVHY